MAGSVRSAGRVLSRGAPSLIAQLEPDKQQCMRANSGTRARGAQRHRREGRKNATPSHQCQHRGLRAWQQPAIGHKSFMERPTRQGESHQAPKAAGARQTAERGSWIGSEHVPGWHGTGRIEQVQQGQSPVLRCTARRRAHKQGHRHAGSRRAVQARQRGAVQQGQAAATRCKAVQVATRAKQLWWQPKALPRAYLFSIGQEARAEG